MSTRADALPVAGLAESIVGVALAPAASRSCHGGKPVSKPPFVICSRPAGIGDGDGVSSGDPDGSVVGVGVGVGAGVGVADGGAAVEGEAGGALGLTAGDGLTSSSASRASWIGG